MARLKRLIFNLISMDPERVGGAARLAQCLAAHVSAHQAPDTRTLVAVGHGTWGRLFPLEGDFQTLEVSPRAKWEAGLAIEAQLEPPTPGRKLAVSLARPFQRGYRFPATWSADTIVHVPTQMIHPRPPKHWNLPYVMNLADLQHEHFPEFFTPHDLKSRRTHFLSSALASEGICVADEWTRRDILAHLPVSPEKVHAIPLAPTWDAAQGPTPEAARATLAAFGLPERFAFYPAQTWVHKNHGRLLEALAALRNRGVVVPLVCCGHQNDHFQVLREQVEALGLADQVRWLGLVSEAEVRALYVAASLIVVPTLFEGGPGIPVLEAMAFGKPLAASTVCGIPEAVADTALLFDPLDPSDMAGAIGRLWSDPNLAAELGAKARARIAQRTWEKTAAAYHAVYEEILARRARG
ncbi:MAG TPA: glycosyltransferase family 1 protein [Holophagaceae bacterium]|nr:glycosyltransferase family 1 protein [Holophagaceae bacterium]